MTKSAHVCSYEMSFYPAGRNFMPVSQSAAVRWIAGGISGSLEASDGFNMFGKRQEIECGERGEA
jgi:hypothetical protein